MFCSNIVLPLPLGPNTIDRIGNLARCKCSDCANVSSLLLAGYSMGNIFILFSKCRERNSNILVMYIMGMSESTRKLITDPINHLLDNCGKSDCHSKCFDCFVFYIATHSIDSSCSTSTTVV